MSNFSNDADLLKWEPDVFRLCRFNQQKLGGAGTGATSAGSAAFTDATGGDFVNAGVDTGHVVHLSKSGAYDDYFPVASRTSATQLLLDAPGGVFTTQSGVTWSVHTFDAQHEEAHFELCERFGIDDENALNYDEEDVFNVRVLRRASVFRVLEVVFRAQASNGEDLFWKKAERYGVLFERALSAARVRFDPDGDGTPDQTKDAHSVDLRVEEAGDAWPT
jgi:hypothetical protein